MATVTLNLPEDVKQRFETAADAHGVTFEEEVLAAITGKVPSVKRVARRLRSAVELNSLLSRLAGIRESIGVTFTAESIDAAKREGRKG